MHRARNFFGEQWRIDLWICSTKGPILWTNLQHLRVASPRRRKRMSHTRVLVKTSTRSHERREPIGTPRIRPLYAIINAHTRRRCLDERREQKTSIRIIIGIKESRDEQAVRRKRNCAPQESFLESRFAVIDRDVRVKESLDRG